jgi:hypothetical protein
MQFLRPPECKTPSEFDLLAEDLKVLKSAEKLGEEFGELHLGDKMTDAMMRAGAEGDVAAGLSMSLRTRVWSGGSRLIRKCGKYRSILGMLR